MTVARPGVVDVAGIDLIAHLGAQAAARRHRLHAIDARNRRDRREAVAGDAHADRTEMAIDRMRAGDRRAGRAKRVLDASGVAIRGNVDIDLGRAERAPFRLHAIRRQEIAAPACGDVSRGLLERTGA